MYCGSILIDMIDSAATDYEFFTEEAPGLLEIECDDEWAIK